MGVSVLVHVGPKRGGAAGHFTHVGAVQQLSATLIWFGRVFDGLTIILTLYVVSRLSGSSWDANHLVVALVFVFFFEFITSYSELYRSWRVVRLRYELSKIAVYWVLASAGVTMVLYVLSGTVSVEQSIVYTWLIASFLLVCSIRVAIRLVLRFARAAGYDRRRVAFVGANEVSAHLAKTFDDHPWMGMNVIGTYDIGAANGEHASSARSGGLAGNVEDLIGLAFRGDVDMIYISQSATDELKVKELVDRFSDSTVSIYYCPSVFNFELINARWDNVFGQPVVSIVDTPFNGHQGLVKRIEDILLLLLLGPFVLVALLLISVMILITSGRPIFFKQSRYGLDGKAFEMWKFRTMSRAACRQEYSQATRNDARVTWFGRLLRKTSLDELPQYLNVLRGDMSFIGPRPHPDVVNDELRKSIHRYMLRHKIKPGITGLAQVNGYRGEPESIEYMEKRLENDLRYIKNWSLWLDVKILMETAYVVSGKDVY